MSLRTKMRAGVFSWGIGNAASRTLRFLAQYALLWILAPSDFGLVVMTTALMNVLQMVSDFGVAVAVIQKKDATPLYVSTAFWLNIAASLFILAVCWVSAPWLAHFYGAPEITQLVRITSLSFPVYALRTIPIAVMRRNMRFGQTALLDTIWNAISGVLMILFAFLGAGYWSLVIPAMITGLVLAPVWYICAQWRPSLMFGRAEFTELFHYAKHLVGAALLALVLTNAGFVIAGHILGPDAAGLFNVAATYSTVILINYAYLIANVSLSGFAARQEDPATLQRGFIRLYEILGGTTLPIHVLGIALAPLIFRALIPAAYASALVSFQALLALAALRCIAAHVAPFYNAINRAHVNLHFYLVSTPLCLTAMYMTCRWAFDNHGMKIGLNALGIATAVSQGLSVIALLAVMRGIMGWRDTALVRSVVPYILASIVAAAIAKLIEQGLTPLGLPALVVLVIATAVGGATYVAILYLAARGRLAMLVREALPVKLRERFVYAWFPALRTNA
ncbi:MAG: oligosaccharide flippase family protein [Candidatus Hydrogenedentes bacterium]|nr:oligosaccharide flippase family protein [Candidatus Hydrogenedentota bacterium]